MSDNEVNQLTEKLHTVEKNLLQAISDLRVDLAGNYVKKSDQKWALVFAATVGAIIITIISNVISWAGGS